jgi:hypothetical protein
MGILRAVNSMRLRSILHDDDIWSQGTMQALQAKVDQLSGRLAAWEELHKHEVTGYKAQLAGTNQALTDTRIQLESAKSAFAQQKEAARQALAERDDACKQRDHLQSIVGTVHHNCMTMKTQAMAGMAHSAASVQQWANIQSVLMATTPHATYQGQAPARAIHYHLQAMAPGPAADNAAGQPPEGAAAPAAVPAAAPAGAQSGQAHNNVRCAPTCQLANLLCEAPCMPSQWQ